MNGNQNQMKLMHQKIKNILLKDWDPIGIQDIPEAQDEYDAYVSYIYDLLISGNSQEKLFVYLWWIETEHMALPGNKQHTQAISNKLYNTFNSLTF